MFVCARARARECKAFKLLDVAVSLMPKQLCANVRLYAVHASECDAVYERSRWIAHRSHAIYCGHYCCCCESIRARISALFRALSSIHTQTNSCILFYCDWYSDKNCKIPLQQFYLWIFIDCCQDKLEYAGAAVSSSSGDSGASGREQMRVRIKLNANPISPVFENMV